MPTTLFSTAATSLFVLSLASSPAPAQKTQSKTNPVPASSAVATPGTPPKAIGETVIKMSPKLWVVFQDRRNIYWFGSDGDGVYRQSGKTITHFTTKDGLINDQIREIQEDKAGNIFFTTLEGISKFDGQAFTTLTVEESKAPDKGWRLNPDDLWFKGLYGKRGHNGPFRYDGKSLYLLKFPKHPLEDEFHAQNPSAASSSYEVYKIYKDSRGHLWFGTLICGACRYDGQSWDWLHENHLTVTPNGGGIGVRSIMEDRDGAFWITNTRHRFIVLPKDKTHQGTGLVEYRREVGASPRTDAGDQAAIYSNAILKDNKQDLWMVTYRTGVWRYDGKALMHYPVTEGGKPVLVVSISRDNQGDLWLGTQEAGAYKLNGKTFEKYRP